MTLSSHTFYLDPGQEFATVVTVASQVIFTVEFLVKIIAEGYRPSRFFTDRQNGSWNCLDAFVVFGMPSSLGTPVCCRVSYCL